MVADAIAQITHPGKPIPYRNWGTAGSIGERGGEVRPKEHLPPGDELMPEPERELRDDLRGIEWLPVGLHPTNRGRNVLVRVSMATDPTGITAQ